MTAPAVVEESTAAAAAATVETAEARGERAVFGIVAVGDRGGHIRLAIEINCSDLAWDRTVE
jgi:hypothetical protein